ncbi:unnamed protein product [Schistosoma curassoni]|uniref:Uncharacterized protein n=1 Tax=Schistosoma curassoni TaxID=6186 RepID=A0A183KKX3_9TREM|nr:unnamed protein product [Schistosoma curassoni]
MSPPSFPLIPFWPDKIEAGSCYSETDFYGHSENDTRAHFLTVVKALPREFNRHVTPSMFTSDVSEPYETMKRSILRRVDLTDRQRLDQLLNNIDPQHRHVAKNARDYRSKYLLWWPIQTTFLIKTSSTGASCGGLLSKQRLRGAGCICRPHFRNHEI